MYLIHRLIRLILFGALSITLVACVSPQQLETFIPVVDGVGRPLSVRNDAIGQIERIAEPGLFETAWDATPDPEAEMVYFTATRPDGAGIFRVSATGGDEEVIAFGEPFVQPIAIVMGHDGQMIYVADPSSKDGGQILTIPVTGGSVIPLAGAQGTMPRGLEIVNEDGVDVLYFSGVDPVDGQPSVMKLVVSSGEVSIVFKGAPLVEPGGLAITSDGTVYVADRLASGSNLGSVFQIVGNEITPIVDSIRMGNPVGAALTLDEAILVVSAMDSRRDSAQVLLIVLASQDKLILNKVVGANSGSGGVHRAHHRNVFAWAGFEGSLTGVNDAPTGGGSGSDTPGGGGSTSGGTGGGSSIEGSGSNDGSSEGSGLSESPTGIFKLSPLTFNRKPESSGVYLINP